MRIIKEDRNATRRGFAAADYALIDLPTGHGGLLRLIRNWLMRPRRR